MADENPHLCLVTLRWVASHLEFAGLPDMKEWLLREVADRERARERAEEVYHFGVWEDDDAGHFTHGENGRHLDFNHIGPWNNLDGNLAPGDRYKNVEGAAALHYHGFEGSDTVWTAISFWDRSSDTRGGCNTGFFVAHECSFAEMCELAAERYPKQWKRLNVPPFLVKTFGSEWSKVYAEKV